MMLSTPGLLSLTQARPDKSTFPPCASVWMVWARSDMKSVK